MGEATTPRRDLLDGVSVVDLGSYITGPFATHMLADLGASVIKIEPPDGDPFRRFGHRYRGVSASWVNINHSKTSVRIDLKSADGYAEALSLIAEADVVVSNWRPGVAESLKLGDRELAAASPRAIRLAISGFGEDGPRSSEPVFDVLLQALSGFAALEGGDGPPAPARSFIADKVTALFATQAILAGLVERARTGEGSRVTVSMMDAMAYFNFPDLFATRTFLDDPAVPADRRPRSPVLPTSDGFVAVSPVSRRQIDAAVTAAGHPEWAEDLRGVRDASVLQDVLYGRLAEVTPHHTTAAWVAVFRRADVPAAAVMTAEEHLEDPQVVHNGLYDLAATPSGPRRRVRHPVRSSR